MFWHILLAWYLTGVIGTIVIGCFINRYAYVSWQSIPNVLFLSIFGPLWVVASYAVYVEVRDNYNYWSDGAYLKNMKRRHDKPRP